METIETYQTGLLRNGKVLQYDISAINEKALELIAQATLRPKQTLPGHLEHEKLQRAQIAPTLYLAGNSELAAS